MTEVLPVTDITLAEIEAAGPGTASAWAARAGRDVGDQPARRGGVARRRRSPTRPASPARSASRPSTARSYDGLWATERASSRDPGWHRTGDVGHLDREGRLWVEGRLVHVITTPDGPLTPVGVEQRVETLPEVVSAAVVVSGQRARSRSSSSWSRRRAHRRRRPSRDRCSPQPCAPPPGSTWPRCSRSRGSRSTSATTPRSTGGGRGVGGAGAGGRTGSAP